VLLTTAVVVIRLLVVRYCASYGNITLVTNESYKMLFCKFSHNDTASQYRTNLFTIKIYCQEFIIIVLLRIIKRMIITQETIIICTGQLLMFIVALSQ